MNRACNGVDATSAQNHNSDYRTESLTGGKRVLVWRDAGGVQRHLDLGKIGDEAAQQALLRCQAEPDVSPKVLLKKSERLEECGRFWLERRHTADTILLGWYDVATRQTRHLSLKTSDTALARRQLYRCADTPSEDPRTVLARPRALTIADLLDNYSLSRGAVLASAVQARIAGAHLRRLVGQRFCDRFGYEDSVKLADALVEQGMSIAYASRVMSVLRSAYNVAKRAKLITAVPDIHEPRTRAHMEAEPLKGIFLETEQIACLVDEIRDLHVLVAIVILINSGARIGSVLDLRHEQVDLSAGLIRFNPDGRLQTKKRRAVIKIPSTLRPWLLPVGASPWIVSRHGRRVTSIKTAIRGMRDRAFLPKDVNTYSIRHSLARWMDRQGVPDKEVSLVLGHVPVSVKRTTLRYTERPESPEYLREATASIEAFVRAIAARTRKVDLLRPPWTHG
ncbi:MAG: tyrosine-type recombinase/integrase [Mesorhizobium sp.]